MFWQLNFDYSYFNICLCYSLIKDPSITLSCSSSFPHSIPGEGALSLLLQWPFLVLLVSLLQPLHLFGLRMVVLFWPPSLSGVRMEDQLQFFFLLWLWGRLPCKINFYNKFILVSVEKSNYNDGDYIKRGRESWLVCVLWNGSFYFLGTHIFSYFSVRLYGLV